MRESLFLDTNVVLDLLGERDPYYEPAAMIVSLADRNVVTVVVSAWTYPTVHYLLTKFERERMVRDKIRKFRAITQTSDLTDSIIEKALGSDFRDFEDALQYHCALQADCDILITRNAKDFRKSRIPVLSAEEYLKSRSAH